MDPAEFTQLGVAGAALLLVGMALKYFTQALDKKDTYIREITEAFNRTIENHIDHETEQRKKETAVLTDLAKAIGDLVEITKKSRTRTRKK